MYSIFLFKLLLTLLTMLSRNRGGLWPLSVYHITKGVSKTMNVCILSGRLSSDPELKQTTDGQYVCRFSVAVKRPFSSRETDFFNCVAWRKKAEFIYQYFSKGKSIEIKGYISNRQWTDKNNQKRTSTEITVDDAGFSFNDEMNESNTTNDTFQVSNNPYTNQVQNHFQTNTYSAPQTTTIPTNVNPIPIDQNDDLPF